MVSFSHFFLMTLGDRKNMHQWNHFNISSNYNGTDNIFIHLVCYKIFLNIYNLFFLNNIQFHYQNFHILISHSFHNLLYQSSMLHNTHLYFTFSSNFNIYYLDLNNNFRNKFCILIIHTVHNNIN